MTKCALTPLVGSHVGGFRTRKRSNAQSMQSPVQNWFATGRGRIFVGNWYLAVEQTEWARGSQEGEGENQGRAEGERRESEGGKSLSDLRKGRDGQSLKGSGSGNWNS